MNDTRQTKPAHELDRQLPHERPDVVRVAIELVELVRSLGSLRGTAGAFDQLRRASYALSRNFDSVDIRDVGSAGSAPNVSPGKKMLHVGSEAGVLYAVEVPLQP